MKRLLILLLVAGLLAACAGNAKPDYNTEQLEEALNNGDSVDNRTVSITVDELVPDSAFGYNIQTGEHLNFVSTKNPNVKQGDELVVKVEDVDSIMGSYIITYKKQ